MFQGVIISMLLSSPQPAVATPAPPLLKTIIRIRSSVVCTGLRESVRPAIAGLLANNEIIANSAPVFDRMAIDAASGSKSSLELNSVRLQRLAQSLLHNFQKMDTYLFDPHYSSIADQDLVNLRHEISDAKAEQQKIVNLISGVTETHELEMGLNEVGGGVDMQQGQGEFGQTVGGPTFSLLNQPGRFQSAFSHTPVGVIDPTTVGPGVGVFGSPYIVFRNSVILQTKRIQQAEDLVAKSTMALAATCAAASP